MREAARLKSSSFPHPASDADIVATIDTVVTVANTVAVTTADIAINATGNIADVTTAFGAAAATTITTTVAANLCDEFDGYKSEQLCLKKICPDINTERKVGILALLIKPLLYFSNSKILAFSVSLVIGMMQFQIHIISECIFL